MVLSIDERNEWQFLCKDGYQTLAWYTRPALDVLEAMDLSDKIVFEWGGGLSTIYYAKHAKEVYTVDWTQSWVENVKDTLAHHNLKGNIFHSDVKDEYVNMVHQVPKPNLFIVDGNYRDECFLEAIKIMTEGDILIFDNWNQFEVFIPSDEVQEEVKKYKHEIYTQTGHLHWKTLFLWK